MQSSSKRRHGLFRHRMRQQPCASCVVEHPLSEFSITALRENRQRCIREEGRLWLCPSMIWSFEQAVERGRGRDVDYGLCACKQHFTALFRGHVIQAFPVHTSHDFARLFWIHVFLALKSIHLRICPHMSFSDRKLVQCFSSLCTRAFDEGKWDCGCDDCNKPLQRIGKYCCSECSTRIQFRIQRNISGSVTAYLLVGKPISEPFLAVSGHGAWKRLITLPSQFQRRKEEWETHQVYGQVDRHQRLSPAGDPFKNTCFIW